jgi:lipid-binding SYLF domain-containing protein
MKTRLLLSSLLLTACVLGPAGLTAQAKGTPDEQRAEIHKTRDSVLDELYRLHPEARVKIKRAAGYAVFTNIGINLILASAAGGHGIVVEMDLIHDNETYMKMGSVGLGLGLGVKDFRAVFIFESSAKLHDFVAHGWDFSGQADAAAKSDSKGGATAAAGTVVPGVEVFQITKNGLALQATLQGTKYWKDKDLN